MILRDNEGQDETSAGKHHDLNKQKNGQEPMNHLHTCIHAYKKLIFSFQENLTRLASMKWGQDTQCSVTVKN